MNTPTRDYELEARLLVKWMNWQWVRIVSRNLCALWPGENDPNGFRPSNPGREVVILDRAPEEEERFENWMDSGWRDVGDLPRIYGIPALSSSLDACAMLKAAVIAKGFTIETVMKSGLIVVRIIDRQKNLVGKPFPMLCGADEAMAICRAVDGIRESA